MLELGELLLDDVSPVDRALSDGRRPHSAERWGFWGSGW